MEVDDVLIKFGLITYNFIYIVRSLVYTGFGEAITSLLELVHSGAGKIYQAVNIRRMTKPLWHSQRS